MTKWIALIAVGAAIGSYVPYLIIWALDACCGWTAP